MIRNVPEPGSGQDYLRCLMSKVDSVNVTRRLAVLVAFGCVLWPNVLLAVVDATALDVEARIGLLCLGLAGAALPLLVSWRSSVMWWCNLPFVLIAPVFAAFVYAYREPPQNGVWVSILATNKSEAMEQIGANWIFVLGGLASFVLYGWSYRYIARIDLGPFRVRASLFSAAVCTIVVCQGLAIPWSYPELRYFRPLSRDLFYGSFPTGAAVVAVEAATHSSTQIVPAPAGLRLSDHGGRQIIVLVVGEAVQYPRWMAAAEDADAAFLAQSDAVILDKNVSQADFTAWSVPLLLSGDAVLGENHPSWIEFAKSAGFSTAWISTNSFEARGNYEARSDHVMDLRTEARHPEPIYDDEMLPALDRVLSGPEQKLCIVIHMTGGHFSYLERYRPADAHYSVDEKSYNNPFSAGYQSAVHASYANAMLKDLHFVEAVEQRLRDQRGAYSMMIYAPDHGENLFDDKTGVLTHGRAHPSIYELNVPVVIWGSERFRQQESAGWQQIKLHVNTTTSSRSVFSTLLWAMGIQGAYSAEHGYDTPVTAGNPARMVNFGYDLTVPFDEVMTWKPDASIEWKNNVIGQQINSEQ